MKRLIKLTAVFILPFVLLFVLFFAFETYDYFGVKNNAHYLDNPLSNVRMTVYDKPERIILGDSRMANLNVGYIKEISGLDYGKLAYGGAEIGESIDLFWWAVEQGCELEQVILGVNFHYLGGTQTGENKIKNVEMAKTYAKNPFKFATNMTHWLRAAANAKNMAFNFYYNATGQPGRIVLNEDPSRLTELEYDPGDVQKAIDMGYGEKWHPFMEYYATELIYVRATGFEVQPQTYDALQEIIDYCDQNGIDLIFVFPPIHEVIYERVIWRLDEEISAKNAEEGTELATMTEKLTELKNFFISRATVYDFEIRNDFTESSDTFFDGFHFKLSGKMMFAEILFTDTDEYAGIADIYIKDGVAIIPEHNNR